MKMRSVPVIVATACALAACGGGGDDGADTTLSEITLLTTTTTEPLFEPESEEPSTEETVVEQTSVPVTSVPPTTVTAESTVPVTTEQAAPASPFSLETDGIGAASFGAAPDGVVDFVSSILGQPTADTGWIDPFDIGPCAGTELRQVTWSDLVLEFGDVSTITEGRQHFYAYYYGQQDSTTATPPGIATETGLTVGSSVAQLLDAHPDADLFSGDEFLGPNFLINDALRGTLSGLADNDVVTSFIGGLPCNG